MGVVAVVKGRVLAVMRVTKMKSMMVFFLETIVGGSSFPCGMW